MTQTPKGRAAGPRAKPRSPANGEGQSKKPRSPATGRGQTKTPRALTIAGQRSSLGRGAQFRAACGRRFTIAKQEAFFVHLAETANIKMSAKHAGISTSTIHQWRRRDECFRARWVQALADGYADIEMRLMAIARFGAVCDATHSQVAEGVKRVYTKKDQPMAMLRMMEIHGRNAEAARAREVEELRIAGQPPLEKIWALIDQMRSRGAAMLEAPRASAGEGAGEDVGEDAGGDDVCGA